MTEPSEQTADAEVDVETVAPSPQPTPSASDPEARLERALAAEAVAPGADVGAEPWKAGVGPHAAVAGIASLIPVPWLDERVATIARGSALRRMALRHGVRLSPEARRTLAKPAVVEQTAPSKLATRAIRFAAARLAAPVRAGSVAGEASRTLLFARLLDRYLAEAPARGWRKAGAAVGGAEAARLRVALGKGLSAIPAEVFESSPALLGGAGRGLGSVFSRSDEEDRSPLERLVDVVLDGGADSLDTVVDLVWDRFVEALADAAVR